MLLSDLEMKMGRVRIHPHVGVGCHSTATACQCSDAKSNLPCTLSAPLRITNLSNSYRGIMMTAGLKSVSTPVSRLLSCLGDKQCHQDDGVKQPGFLACRNHNAAEPVLLPEMKPRSRVAMSVPMGTSPNPSAHTELAGTWGYHLLRQKRETQAVSSVTPLEYEPYT